MNKHGAVSLGSPEVIDGLPVIDPVTARKGRFIVARRDWGDLTWWADALREVMLAKPASWSRWQLVATQHTEPRTWALYAVPREVLS